jgi:arsenate reductase
VKKRVLFLCTGNRARSQMAEGLLRHLAGDVFEVFSAGTEPRGLSPVAVAVMGEIGIDIAGHRSKSVDAFLGQEFDYVITLCDEAREACPVFPGAKRHLHWGIPDPAAAEGSGAALEAFRRARDEIRRRIEGFLREERAARP